LLVFRRIIHRPVDYTGQIDSPGGLLKSRLSKDSAECFLARELAVRVAG
jgi:hypothetical protein